MRACENYMDEWGQDDLIVASKLIPLVENNLDEWQLSQFRRAIKRVRDREASKTAWQIDATLREFPGFDPINIWFEYPVHRIDGSGALKDIKPEAEKTPWEKSKERIKEQNKQAHAESIDRFQIAFTNLELNEKPILADDIAAALDVPAKTVRSWFGNGRARKKDLKNMFELYIGEDQKRYIRRRREEGCDTEL
jgi:hypothetical protein